MDIELLSRMVGELIVDHDMVGLPGVGTFVAEVVPATFSDKGYTINPPYRRLSFHPSKGEEDLLVDLYSVTNGINREAARIYLTQFLQEMKSVLKDRKTIVFPGLGRMRATKENNFFFIQDQEIDIFPNGYALPAVSLKAQQDDPEPVRISVPPIVLTPDLQSAQPEPLEALQEQPEPEPQPELQPELQEEPESEPEPLEALQPEPLSQKQTEMPQERTEVPQAQSELQPELQEEPESEPEPLEVLQEQPEPESQEQHEPQTTPQPQPEEVVAEPVAMEQDHILEFADEPQPASQPEPEPVPEPEPAPEPAPVPAPRPQAAKPAETAARTTTIPTKQHLWWVPVVIILALAVTAFAVFLILAEVAPDFIDSILYTPEELRIINY